MSRPIPVLLLACAAWLHAQDSRSNPQQPPPKTGGLKTERTPPKSTGKEEAPPEEDESLAVKNYSFNPLQAKKCIVVGNYYFKKGSFRAAAGRFREATMWNEGDSEAWLRLGETEERLKDPKAAKEAYTKYLALAADAKNAPEIRKKLEKLR